MWWTNIVFYLGMLLVLALGGGLGTYFPIRNARTPAELKFMIQVAVVFWAVLLLLIVLPQVLAFHDLIPGWITWPMLGISLLLIFLTIPWINRRAVQLRREQEPPAAGK